MTKLRQEFERISNEIHLKFKNKMLNLRQEMENKRKSEIKKIQEKKDQAIKELTAKHDQKYIDIKTYYTEITNTNLDIIKQLKDELIDARKDNGEKQKQKMDCQEQNNKIVEPLNQANEEVTYLEKKKKTHDQIMDKLSETQQLIAEYDERSKDIEWQYEVRLQQYRADVRRRNRISATCS